MSTGAYCLRHSNLLRLFTVTARLRCIGSVDPSKDEFMEQTGKLDLEAIHVRPLPWVALRSSEMPGKISHEDESFIPGRYG